MDAWFLIFPKEQRNIFRKGNSDFTSMPVSGGIPA